MKKKKLALLMVAALTFTNLDGTVVALKAADFAVDLSEETTDEFGDVETPDEQKEEASDIEIEDTDEVGEDLESTEDFDEQQGLDIFSDGEEIECESDQTGISGIHEVVADEYVTLEEGTQKLSITENTRNEFGLFDFTCEFTPKEDGYYVFELSGNDDIVTNITLEDRWSVGEDDYYNDTNASTKPFCLGARLKKGKTYSYNLSIVDMGQLSVSIAKKEEKQIKNVRLAGLENIDTNSFQLFQELKDIFGIEVTYADNSANGTYSSVARENIESERLQLLDEIDRISQTTDFDGIPLFKEYPGNLPPGYVPPEKEGEITLQIGHSEAETLDVERYYMGSKELLLKDMDFTTVDNANQAVDTIEDAIEAVADVRASFGASLNHLEHTSSNLGVTKENMTVAESRIRDTDMAEQITAYTTENIILQSSNSMMVHANSLPDLVIQLLQG